MAIWGEPERAPHKQFVNAHNIHMYGGGGTSIIRVPLHSKYLQPYAMFCAEKSACTKITATMVTFCIYAVLT